MRPEEQILDSALAGIGVGAALVLALVVVFSAVNRPVRLTAVAALASLAALLIASSPLQDLLAICCRPLDLALAVYALTAAGFLWLAVIAIFVDEPLRPWRAIPAGLLGLCAICQFAAPALGPVLEAASSALIVGLGAHAAWVVLRGWKSDLLESRRRLRAPLLLAVTAAIGLAIMDGLLSMTPGWRSATTTLVIDGLYALVTVVVAVSALGVRPDFLPTARRPFDTSADQARRTDLAAIEHAMMAEESWRRENLTIGDLASATAIPAHRLRRLINQTLSHRNFSAFVNAYRIAEAKRRLVEDPDKSVTEIAYDLGFASINPFNRAFNALTGRTPTAWRTDPPEENSGQN